MSSAAKVLFSLSSFLVLALAAVASVPTTAFAGSYHLTYGGQVLDTNGNPITTQVNFSVNFYRTASISTAILVTPVTATAVPDATGVYNIDLPLADSDMQTVFPGPGSDVWIEADTVVGGVTTTQPRQRYSAVPYALKIPVDGTTLAYGSTGLLSVTSVPAALLTGTIPGTVSVSTASVTGNLPASQLTGPLPALNGASLTSLSPTALSAGTAGISISGNAATAGTAVSAATASSLTAAGWASPGAIGSTVASTGAFTTLTATSHAGGGAGLTGLTASNITPGGTLPALNGGALTTLSPAALSSGTAGISISGNAATATSAVSATTALNVSGTVAVANGGTGAGALAGNGALVMNAAGNAVTSVAPGASGNVLASNGTNWYSTPSAVNLASPGPIGATTSNTGAFTTVGVGTTSPTRLFQINASGTTGGFLFKSTTNSVNPVLELQDASPGQALNAGINFLNGVSSASAQINFATATNSLNLNSAGSIAFVSGSTTSAASVTSGGAWTLGQANNAGTQTINGLSLNFVGPTGTTSQQGLSIASNSTSSSAFPGINLTKTGNSFDYQIQTYVPAATYASGQAANDMVFRISGSTPYGFSFLSGGTENFRINSQGAIRSTQSATTTKNLVNGSNSFMMSMQNAFSGGSVVLTCNVAVNGANMVTGTTMCVANGAAPNYFCAATPLATLATGALSAMTFSVNSGGDPLVNVTAASGLAGVSATASCDQVNISPASN